MAIDFPDDVTELRDNGTPRSFADIDGAGTTHDEWMAEVGLTLNGLQDGTALILTDTTDGHTYRIVSTNGVLSTVQVT